MSYAHGWKLKFHPALPSVFHVSSYVIKKPNSYKRIPNLYFSLGKLVTKDKFTIESLKKYFYPIEDVIEKAGSAVQQNENKKSENDKKESLEVKVKPVIVQTSKFHMTSFNKFYLLVCTMSTQLCQFLP